MYPGSVAVLQEYAQRIENEARMINDFDNDEYLRLRENMLLGIGEESGRFLNQLVLAARPKTLVEVGTAFGYSTLWIADAAKALDAMVFTYEISQHKQEYAASMMRKAGLADHIKFVVGDAPIALKSLKATADFVLIDLWKDLYIPAFEAIRPNLSLGAIVVADNMLFPDYQREAAHEYQAHILALDGVESMTLPIGSGLEFSIINSRC